MPASATLLTDRRASCPYGAPPGADAGEPGSAGRNPLLRTEGTVDRLRTETPGGVCDRCWRFLDFGRFVSAAAPYVADTMVQRRSLRLHSTWTWRPLCWRRAVDLDTSSTNAGI